jgi:hypothetical protein
MLCGTLFVFLFFSSSLQVSLCQCLFDLGGVNTTLPGRYFRRHSREYIGASRATLQQYTNTYRLPTYYVEVYSL